MVIRVGVLEWICGGGYTAMTSEQIPASLRNEGAAMLSCLLQVLCEHGCHVSTVLDERMLAAGRWQADVLIPMTETARHGQEYLPTAWLRLAHQTDVLLVVAPELGGVLPRLLGDLRAAGARLLNCDGELLDNACDKLRTAGCLAAAGIAHPPTIPLEQLTQDWLDALCEPELVVKPRDGAGSEGIAVYSKGQLACGQLAQSVQHSGVENYIVQPLIRGGSYSCSGIIDRYGVAHWMPLFTQVLTEKLAYCGGRRASDGMQDKQPIELLNRTLAALGEGGLGWIGVDLVFECQTQTWHVIEVNPRCTTSLIGIAPLCKRGLGTLLCEAVDGACGITDFEIRDIAFLANGRLTP